MSNNRTIWDWIKYNIRAHAIQYSKRRAKERSELEIVLQNDYTVHLCPGLNAVTNFASFTIFRFSFKFNKFCDFSLNSTRYTKIRCLNDFSVRCAEIYNFMLTRPASAGLQILQNLQNLRFFANFAIFQ